jgi:hypothetical protein
VAENSRLWRCSRGWHLAQQEADVLDEAEVEHAVGLVHHHDLGGAEVHDVLLDVVDQAPGRGDHHVGAGAQQLALLVVVDAAIDQRVAQAALARDLGQVLLDLDRELARRRQDHRARILRAPVGVRGRRSRRFTMVTRNASVLPVPVWRLAGDVLAGERQRQREGLDRGEPYEVRLLEPCNIRGCSGKWSKQTSVRGRVSAAAGAVGVSISLIDMFSCAPISGRRGRVEVVNFDPIRSGSA